MAKASGFSLVGAKRPLLLGLLLFSTFLSNQLPVYADDNTRPIAIDEGGGPPTKPTVCRVTVILEYINIIPIWGANLTEWNIDTVVTLGNQPPMRHSLARYLTTPEPRHGENNYWYPYATIGTIDVPKTELDRGFTVSATLRPLLRSGTGSSRVSGYSGNGCPDEGRMDVWALIKDYSDPAPAGYKGGPSAWVLLRYHWQSTLVSGTDGLVYRPSDDPPGCRFDLMLRGIIVNEDTEIGNDEWIIRTQATIGGQPIEFTTPMFSANVGEEMIRLEHRIGRVELPSRSLPARVDIRSFVTEDDLIEDENGDVLIRDLRSRAICAGVRSYIFTVDGYGREMVHLYEYFKVTLFYELETAALDYEPIPPER